jgi:hypothetical protein
VLHSAIVNVLVEPSNETDQEFRAVQLKALDDPILNNVGQPEIHGHIHSTLFPLPVGIILDRVFFGHVFCSLVLLLYREPGFQYFRPFCSMKH